MSYFDSKTIDYFSSYGKIISLNKSCRCGRIRTSIPMPNIVIGCEECHTHVHPVFYK